MSKKGLLYYIQDHAFNIFIILTWISIITLSLGFTIINPKYISTCAGVKTQSAITFNSSPHSQKDMRTFKQESFEDSHHRRI
jgi:hypothetical protein